MTNVAIGFWPLAFGTFNLSMEGLWSSQLPTAYQVKIYLVENRLIIKKILILRLEIQTDKCNSRQIIAEFLKNSITC